jgi:hypothetical protein
MMWILNLFTNKNTDKESLVDTDYEVVFKPSSMGTLPNQKFKASLYRIEDGFVHFWLSTRRESIASFAADNVLSITKA